MEKEDADWSQSDGSKELDVADDAEAEEEEDANFDFLDMALAGVRLRSIVLFA